MEQGKDGERSQRDFFRSVSNDKNQENVNSINGGGSLLDESHFKPRYSMLNINDASMKLLGDHCLPFQHSSTAKLTADAQKQPHLSSSRSKLKLVDERSQFVGRSSKKEPQKHEEGMHAPAS